MKVEILTFAGCPNGAPAYELVVEVARKLGVDATVELVDVPDPEAAERRRRLGTAAARLDPRGAPAVSGQPPRARARYATTR